MNDALDELHFLAQALSAHLNWAKLTGSAGVPPCTEEWLSRRREHYRLTPAALPDELPSTAQAPPDPRALATDDVPPVAREVRPAAAENSVSPPLPPVNDAQALVSPPVPLVNATHTAVSPPLPPVNNAALRPAAPFRSEPLAFAEAHARLRIIAEEVSTCTACSLCDTRTQTVFARGDGSAGVAFVGEGPGADEDAQGLPFVGAAGQLLDRMIGAMGLNRDGVYVCNVIKCRPPKNRKPSEEEMAACRPFLTEQLELIRPKVIVAMGATAVEGLLGLKMGITRLRGTWRLYNGRIPVMPTFHPAYLLRQPDAKRLVWEDLQAVLGRLNLPIPNRRT